MVIDVWCQEGLDKPFTTSLDFFYISWKKNLQFLFNTANWTQIGQIAAPAFYAFRLYFRYMLSSVVKCRRLAASFASTGAWHTPKTDRAYISFVYWANICWTCDDITSDEIMLIYFFIVLFCNSTWKFNWNNEQVVKLTVSEICIFWIRYSLWLVI